VMKGYWNREEETSNVIQDGWLLTGDMATMDEDGFFAIVDRKKDLIIASGFNIYPREIEEVLYEHTAIKEAAVAGVPDQYRGETVKAFVVLRDGAKLTDKELEAWCRERLAAFKVPRKYEFRESLPKTMVGKVLRRKLLEEEADGQNKDEKQ
jgi:long-chain acyl-CoA synthetase